MARDFFANHKAQQCKNKAIAKLFLTETSLKSMQCPCFFGRKATEEMLRRAREDQVKNKEHFLAVQAGRDRAEFERVLK